MIAIVWWIPLALSAAQSMMSKGSDGGVVPGNSAPPTGMSPPEVGGPDISPVDQYRKQIALSQNPMASPTLTPGAAPSPMAAQSVAEDPRQTSWNPYKSPWM